MRPADTDMTITRLREWLPTDQAGGPDLAGARARLIAHIGGAERARPPRRPRWWLLAPGTAVTAIVVVIVLTLTSGLDEGSRSPATAQALDRAAHNLTEYRPFPTLGDQPGFLYTKRSGTSMSCSVFGQDTPNICTHDGVEREDWLSPRQPGLLVERRGATGWATPTDKQRWIDQGRPRIDRSMPAKPMVEPLNPTQVFVGNIEVSPDGHELAGLDPRALYQRIYDAVQDGQGSGRAAETFVQITDALREGLVPTELQAKLYQALAFVPGIRYFGAGKDRLGRKVERFGRSDPNARTELLIDARNGAMLGEQEVSLGGDAGIPAGTVMNDMLTLERAVVQSAGDRP